MKYLQTVAFCLFWGILLSSGSAWSQTDKDVSKPQMVVDKAVMTFDNFMADPDMTWVKHHISKAKGVVIVPDLLKAGFIFGGSGGHGILLGRDEKTGKWSNPAFYSIGSVSWGLQIGAQKSEVIMLVMSKKGLESLFSSSLKLGADASVATGPVGAGAAAKGFTADIISFARSKGAFAGLSLEGAVIKINSGWNDDYYGKPASPVDIIAVGKVNNSGSAKLRNRLNSSASTP